MKQNSEVHSPGSGTQYSINFCEANAAGACNRLDVPDVTAVRLHAPLYIGDFR